jgi:ADP-ribose pyrophosphatase YjhB (NUDIX family)
MKFIVASGPVIIEKGKVLLDKHGKDKFWKFPGGKVVKGKGLEKAAIDNVKKELGIDVDIIRSLKPMILWKNNETIILIHYLAKRSGKIKPAPHVREWIWADINKLPKDVGPNIRPVLIEVKKR